MQQAHKADRITFTALAPWPGDLVCAEGRYVEGEGSDARERRAAIFIGPEFGTVAGFQPAIHHSVGSVIPDAREHAPQPVQLDQLAR